MDHDSSDPPIASTSSASIKSPLNSKGKSPKKSPRKSPLSSKPKLMRGETELSESGSATGGCLSQPSSPSLSGRLGRVTRMISRSDANLVHSLKGKRNRHDSGDSSSGRVTPSHTPEDSPSRGASFMAKASGYVTLMKSRLGKHRDRVREESLNRERLPGQQSFSSCCGHRHPQDESSDTLAAGPGGSSVPSRGESGSLAVDSQSISVNVSYSNSSTDTNSNSNATSAFSKDSHTLTSYSTSNCSSQAKANTQGKLQLNNCTVVGATTTANDPEGMEGNLNQGQAMAPQFPFHTMTVHLQRGKNLVAKDTCGSSDPYVKVKIGDKLLYKSKTINRDLNPIWDESFVLPISDLNQQIIFKVFDYDWGFQDDFMGMTSIDPSRLPANKLTELSLILTETNTPGTESMGEISLSVTLVPRTIEEKEIWISGDGQTGRLVDAQKRLKSQIWSSVLTILLLEAKNLSPGEEVLIMDTYVKFRLGNQKYKTRTVQRTSSPKWIEQFDFYLYEGQPQILEVQVYDESFSKDYIGRVAVDIGLLEKEKTHHQTLKLQESNGEISMLLTISGTSGAESISDLTHYNPSSDEAQLVKAKYAFSRSLTSIKDVGYLTVKVFEAQGLAALDIGGKSDPFCVLELVNARLQTQTEYRTLNPIWNKIFTFAVKDITSILEVTVYDEDKNHKQEFLGKLNIPLWKIKSGEKKWYMLKDRKMLRSAPGNNPKILLELDLAWNSIRAGIRIMDPPEPKFILPDQRLKREIFLLNIDRIKKIGIAIYDVVQYIESCVEWEYPLRSIIALVTYQVVVYTFQPCMLPLFLLLLMLRQWFVTSITGKTVDDELSAEDESFMDDDDDDKEEDDKKMTLRQKLQAVQDATQTVQNAIGDIASIIESSRNTFRMTVPFVSWLVVLGLFIGTIILYFIPVRYLAMAWGFHRFFRPILRPNVIPTNEVYNIIIRVPDNLELMYFRPLRPSSSPRASTSERNRSPPGVPGPKGKEPKKKYKFW